MGDINAPITPIMEGSYGYIGWRTFVLFLSLALLLRTANSNDIANDCWESCFTASASNTYPNEYAAIYQMVSDFHTARMMSSSNGTVFLYDATLPKRIRSSQAASLIEFEKNLAQIIAFSISTTTSNNPFFLAKYDNTHGWFCYEWQCLGRCDAYNVIDTEFDTSLKSGNPDQLDDACYAAAKAMDIIENPEADSHYSCHEYTGNELVVAITNSQFSTLTASNSGFGLETQDIINDLDGGGGDFLIDSSGDFQDYCNTFFPNRVIVGTHDASQTDMAGFTTEPNGSVFIDNDSDAEKAANALSQCMASQCCGGSARRKRQQPGDTCEDSP